jgi:L-lactate dehydrogenase complex protein LldF
VKIDLHDQLVAWRGSDSPRPAGARRLARWAARILARPSLYRAAGFAARALWPLAGRRFPANPANAWLAARDLPQHPGASFRARFRARASGKDAS